MTHRVTQKECLNTQAKLLTLILNILKEAQNGISLKEAYMKQYATDSDEIDLISNRIRIRKYLQELNHYSSIIPESSSPN